MKKSLRCPWSKSTKIATTVILLLFVGLAAYCAYRAITCPCESTRYIIGATILLVVLAIVFCNMPRKLVIDADGITIRLMGYSIRTPWAEMESIEPLNTEHLSQVCGSSGLFGHIGFYRDSQKHTVIGFITDMSSAYIIRRKGKRAIVVSANEPPTRPIQQ